MTCSNLVGACFGNSRAPFAAHPSDAKDAFAYLQCCFENNMSWADVEAQLGAYLEPRGSTEHYTQWVNSRIRKAQSMFLPWLELSDGADGENVVEFGR